MSERKTVDDAALRLMVVSLRRGDEVALARYAIQAAHARAGAVMLLDLREATGLDEGLPELLAEFRSTVQGNGQSLALLADPSTPGAPRAAGLDGSFEDLGEALRTLLAPEGRVFRVELTLPSRVEDLPAVRGYLLDRHHQAHGEAEAFEVGILIDELCQNAIENSPSNLNYYEVAFDCAAARVQLEVTNIADDTIVPQRIMQRRLASFDDSGDYLGERGRGLFLIARIADQLEIRAGEDERITVVATKRVAAPGA